MCSTCSCNAHGRTTSHALRARHDADLIGRIPTNVSDWPRTLSMCWSPIGFVTERYRSVCAIPLFLVRCHYASTWIGCWCHDVLTDCRFARVSDCVWHRGCWLTLGLLLASILSRNLSVRPRRVAPIHFFLGIPCCLAQYLTTLHHTIQHYTIACHAMPRQATPRYAALHHTAPRRATPRNSMPHHTVSFQNVMFVFAA